MKWQVTSSWSFILQPHNVIPNSGRENCCGVGTGNHVSFILGVEGDPHSGVTVRAETALGCIPPLQLTISPAVH